MYFGLCTLIRLFLVKLSSEGNTTGIKNENGNRSGYNIFPNPGGSKFTIQCDEPGSGSLKITVRNSLGQIIQEKELSCEDKKSWELDLGRQQAGNYSVEIVAGGLRTVKKVLID